MLPNSNSGRDNVSLTCGIVSAYIGNNALSARELPRLIADIHGSITDLRNGGRAPNGTDVNGPSPRTGAEIEASQRPDVLISFENGKHYKILRRHLAKLGLTPDGYRRKWGLPDDYPMVAPAYSEKRARLARAIQLGVVAVRRD